METLTKTRKVGGSLMVTLPRELVEKEGITDNQLLIIDVRKVKKSGFGITKGLPSFSEDSKFRGQRE